MGRELVNLPGGGVGVVPDEKNKTAYHRQLVSEMNEISEKKRLERIAREKKDIVRKIRILKIICFILGILAAATLYFYLKK
jgi:hypothetical protein